MFNGHSMSLVTDLSLVANDIRNIDFVLVASITSTEQFNAPNIYYAGVLMPPTELLMRWADGDYLCLQNEYPQYLMTKDCDDLIVALIAAMTKRNVILYIPEDEYEVYGEMLLKHLYFIYGITCNTPFSQFSIAQEKIPFIITKFYLMDIMDVKDYMGLYPLNYPLPDIVINKLAEDIRPFGGAPMSFMEYKSYFENLRHPQVQQNPERKQIYHLVKKG